MSMTNFKSRWRRRSMSSSKLTAKTSLPGFFPLKTSRKHSITSRQASENYITNITFRQSHYKAVRLLVTFPATICHAGNQIIHLAAHKTNNIHWLPLSGTKSKVHCQGKIIDKREDNSIPKVKCILLFCHAEKMQMRDEEIPWVMVKGSWPALCDDLTKWPEVVKFSEYLSANTKGIGHQSTRWQVLLTSFRQSQVKLTRQ